MRVRIEMSLVKEYQAYILAERGRVWYFIGGTVTLSSSSRLRQNCGVALLCLMSSWSQSDLV